jgi:hypothetical protein
MTNSDTTYEPDKSKPGTTDASAISNDERDSFLWNVHSYTREHIRFADTKAAVVTAWSSGLLGVLLTAKLHHYFTQSRFTLADAEFATSCFGITSFVAFACLTGAFVLAIWATAPRLWTSHQKGFLFWESILAHRTSKEFWSRFSEQRGQELTRHTTEHLFDLARVCTAKYRRVNWSIVLASIGSVAAGITALPAT